MTAHEDQLELKDLQDKLRISEMRFQVLSDLSKSKFQNVQELLDFALEEVIKLTDSKLGYIYFYNAQKQEFILNSWSNEAMKQCRITKKQTVYQLEKTGIWGEAVRQGKPIIINDFEAPNPLKKGYPEGHVQLIKYMSIPVFRNKQIVAVVGLANKQADYTDDDVKELTLFMDYVWQLVENKKTEGETRRLAAIVESSNDAILTKDLNGIITSWNQGAVSLYGYISQEIVGKNIEVLLPEDRKDEVTNILERVKRGEKIDNLETIRVKKDGVNLNVSLTISPLKDEYGKIIGASSIARDITKQKEKEQTLEKMNKLMVGRELKMIELKKEIARINASQNGAASEY